MCLWTFSHRKRMWWVRGPLPEISATPTSQLCMILPYLHVALESQELLQHTGREGVT